MPVHPLAVYPCTLVLLLAAGPPARARQVPFAAVETLAGLHAWGWRESADIDGDGDLDVFATEGGHPVHWYEQLDGTAPPIFAEHAIFSVAASEFVERIAAVDLDRDGDMDLALLINKTDTDSVRVAWAENDGTPAAGAWPRHNVVTWDPPLAGSLSAQMGYGSMASGDVDADGDPDLIVSYAEWQILESAADGRVVWLSSDGTPADGGWTTEPLVD